MLGSHFLSMSLLLFGMVLTGFLRFLDHSHVLYVIVKVRVQFHGGMLNAGFWVLKAASALQTAGVPALHATPGDLSWFLVFDQFSFDLRL